MKPIISVEGLGKSYVIRHEGQKTHYKSLREELFKLPKQLVGANINLPPSGYLPFGGKSSTQIMILGGRNCSRPFFPSTLKTGPKFGPPPETDPRRQGRCADAER